MGVKRKRSFSSAEKQHIVAPKGQWAAQLRNAVLTTQAIQHDPELLF